MATAAVTTRPTDHKSNTDTYFGKARNEMDDMEKETEDGLRKWPMKISRISIGYWISLLDDIHQGVNRLKLLALQMNEELESQKPLTDRLYGKIDALNDGVNKKNKDMKTILLR